jgi:hypothetical protein
MAAAPPTPAKARPKARSRRATVPESPVPAPTSVDYADMLSEDGWQQAAMPSAGRARTPSKGARSTTAKGRTTRKSKTTA